MSIVVHRRKGVVIADIGTKETTLQGYRSERDAAMALVQQLQLRGVATKKDWLECSERIRLAAERFLKESEANEPASTAT